MFVRVVEGGVSSPRRAASAFPSQLSPNACGSWKSGSRHSFCALDPAHDADGCRRQLLRKMRTHRCRTRGGPFSSCSLTVGLTGSLRVSCIASFLAHQLSRDVCRFQQQHPELIVELHHNDRVYDPIQERYDISIQPSDVGGENIVRQPIVPLRRLLVAAPDYFERHGRPRHPDQLISHRCAHNNYILPIADLVFNGPSGPVRIPPIRPIVLSNSIWMIREAAVSGDCVAILPVYSIVDELRSGALLPVFEDFRIDAAVLNAFYRRSPQVPAKVRMLLKYLKDQYDSEPPWERRLFRGRAHLRRIVYGPECASSETGGRLQ